MVSLPELLTDLRAEHRALDAVLAPLRGAQWLLETPAVGWTIRDQLAHLAFFDQAALVAATDPRAFAGQIAGVGGDPVGLIARHVAAGRSMPGEEVLAGWRRARSDLLEAFAGLAGAARVRWYGPSMSAASLATARLMESWAHGQDVVDALRVERQATARLRHIAHLGVRARPYSFAQRGLEVPCGEVHVELTGPSGERWAWGDAGATDRVTGPALDFCLAVTRRRHPADTSLAITGELATAWMAIAQAFAGPPVEGRRPGQFAR